MAAICNCESCSFFKKQTKNKLIPFGFSKYCAGCECTFSGHRNNAACVKTFWEKCDHLSPSLSLGIFFTPFLFLALDFDGKRLVSGLAFARYIQPR